MSILNHVPEGYTLRDGQKAVLLAFERAYKEGTRNFIMDCPVGAGKSLIVKVLQNYLGSSYVLTPRINLQLQYTKEFKDARKLIGRKWLPCTWKDADLNNHVVPIIKQGKFFKIEERSSCAGAICTKKPAAKRKKILEECANYGECPYTVLVNTASESDMVVANVHSFLAQTKWRPELFGHRKIVAQDEGHLLSQIVRDSLKVSFTINRMVAPKEIEFLRTVAHWCSWLGRAEQVSTFSDEDVRDNYLSKIEQFEQIGEGVFGSPVIAQTIFDPDKELFRVSFIPYNVGGAVQKLIFEFGDVAVALSGTWYGKQVSCQELGFDPSLTAYISIPSDFPAKNRMVKLPPPDLDLSHKNWEVNLPKLAAHINEIVKNRPKDRTLIHVTSYTKAMQLSEAMKNPRVITHFSEDFKEKLELYLATEGAILISPSCWEGVSLDNDRCRINILTALPFPSAGDPYWERVLKNGRWDLYNTQCLRQIGQALGRGVRHKDDKCDNYLMDTRFGPFLKKMQKVLPDWFKESLTW